MKTPDHYPAVNQGVRILCAVRNKSVQLTGIVREISSQGDLMIDCMDQGQGDVLAAKRSVILEYFRSGIVYKMHSAIAEAGQIATDGKTARAHRVVRIAAPDQIQKIQRRRFPRVLVAVPVDFMKVDLPPGFDATAKKGKRLMGRWSEELDSQACAAQTEALSASGVRMRSEGMVEKGDALLLRLHLPGESLLLLGNVVWLASQAPREMPGHSIGVDFVGMHDDERKKLLDFVGERALK